MNRKHVIGYGATAFVALAIGAAGSSGEAAPTVSGAAPPTVTATVTAGPTQTVEVPAPTVTVGVAGPVKTVTAPPPPPAVAMAGDGVYQVGVDVKPGTYVSDAPASGNCYWERNNGGDGLDSIIDNDNSSGRSVVTIRKTDKFFKSSGCNDWTRR
ncbi:hypothetical protein N865_19205 [Intrasporangium oryzae NRRL B-24470]|uniref:Uncharacterized protein n=1 Tax=Intrasporangium oryzae NRRL B-24470 TaxID=1386089 RepID=W9GDP9_9MICO|nr:hypothetical protein [Intrasporangium oryzae]EWT03342.1 hypothetical protein N865_19205 [Intrasporangium oryzae NRRL B-24470]